MSFTSLLDHVADVYRLTEATSALGEKKNTYTVNGQIRLALVPPRLDRQSDGAGQSARGVVEGYALASADLADEDVLNVTEGPETGRVLRVTGLTRPRGHHIEFMVEPFRGKLA